jgi:hypothetical protein
MNQAKTDALYLMQHYKQTDNKGFVEMLFTRLTKDKTPAYAARLAKEFKALLKASKL